MSPAVVAAVALDPEAARFLSEALGAQWRKAGCVLPAGLNLVTAGLSEPSGPGPLRGWCPPPDDADVPMLMTKTETAEHLRVSPRTVGRLAAAGSLPAVRVGGSPRFRRADVEAFITGLVA